MKRFLSVVLTILAAWIFAYVVMKSSAPWSVIAAYWWVVTLKNMMDAG